MRGTRHASLLPSYSIPHVLSFTEGRLKFMNIGTMKVPPNQPDEQIVNNSVDTNNADSDDGLNDAPHSPSREGDFSEYMWMENEEEFEEQIMQQLEEEALVQQCIDDVCAEMDAYIASLNEPSSQNGNSSRNGDGDSLSQELQNLSVGDSIAQVHRINT